MEEDCSPKCDKEFQVTRDNQQFLKNDSYFRQMCVAKEDTITEVPIYLQELYSQASKHLSKEQSQQVGEMLNQFQD